LRAPILAVPRLGTLNAHMGLLPFYRGMNVTEWAAFNGDPVGCTAHLIDAGIDTGPIVCVQEVVTTGARTVVELRTRVDEAQIALLGRVVRYASTTGTLPLLWEQAPSIGRQFFRMHADLAAVLERELGQSNPQELPTNVYSGIAASNQFAPDNTTRVEVGANTAGASSAIGCGA